MGEDRETTIIDGNQAGSVFKIVDADSAYIAGFTIQNGTGTSDAEFEPYVGGGGVFSYHSSSQIEDVIIQNCNGKASGILFTPENEFDLLIVKNSVVQNCAGGDWGAITSHNGIIEDVIIQNCTTGYQGGAMSGSNNVIRNSVFRNNSAGSYGGAYATDGGQTTIINSSFINNTAGFGGGVRSSWGAQVDLINVNLINNSATNGGPAYLEYGGILNIIQSNIQGNTPTEFSFQDDGSSQHILNISYSNYDGVLDSIDIPDGTYQVFF